MTRKAQHAPWHTFKRTLQPAEHGMPGILVDGKLKSTSQVLMSIIENLEHLNRTQETALDFLTNGLNYCVCNYCREVWFQPNRDPFLPHCADGAILHGIDACCVDCAAEIYEDPDYFDNEDDHFRYEQDLAYWLATCYPIVRRAEWFDFGTQTVREPLLSIIRAKGWQS